ncbi:MAG: hypothetical protein R3A44_36665 [Caldilineaceae bacterium]
MPVESVKLDIPTEVYRRLENTARSMAQPLQEVILHALSIGSPPTWEDAPAEFQTELAVMDRLDDSSLWKIARSKKRPEDMLRYDELLERNQDGVLTDGEKLELQSLRHEADLFMLRKAHAAALLKWRGYSVPKP